MQSNPWTIKIGMTPGGAEVRPGSVSGNGSMAYPYLSIVPVRNYVVNAGDYLYLSTTGISGKIYLKYTVMPAIGTPGHLTAGLYLGKSKPKITRSIFYGTWALNPPFAFTLAAGIKPQWEITNSSFIRLGSVYDLRRLLPELAQEFVQNIRPLFRLSRWFS